MGDANLAIYAAREIHHVVDHLLQGAPNAAVNLVGRAVDRALDRLFGRKLEDRIDEISKHADRLESTLAVVAAQLQTLGAHAESAARINRECAEPATQTFVAACIEAALQSPDPAKHCVLGDLIAARLTTQTETFEALQLQRAQEIVAACNAAQILALARVLIVTAPPFSGARPVSLPQLLQFFDAVDAGTAVSGATYRDMRYLVSLGALTETPEDELHPHASPWMNLIEMWQVGGIYDPPVLQFENRVQAIAHNRAPNGVEMADGVAFGTYALTPPGFTIATRVASRLSGVPLAEH